jgi:small subunit ribosomal protein S18
MAEELNPTPDLEKLIPPVFDGLDGEDTAVEEEEVGEDVEGEGAEDESGDGFSGPEEYVEREKGERRRVGTDVRIDDVNYKNVPLLSRFLDRRGRIMSRRKTRVSAKMQRRIVREVKRARHLALLPYTADQTRQVRRRR